jgi:predicted enzyme related to lactoylglutathione lyase
MGNPFVHVELVTGDVNKAKDFYGKLFDWKLEDIPGMDYTMVNVGEGTGGGMMKAPSPDIQPQWLPYVQVKDVEKAIRQAEGLGAAVMKESTEVPGMGWFGVLIDPTGAAFAVWQIREG